MSSFTKEPKYIYTECGKHFFVQIVAWNKNIPENYMSHLGEWGWNLYACLHQESRLFNNADFDDLYFHGGITYDRMENHYYSNAEYDWQVAHTIRKVGADYQHLGDEYFSQCDPKEGVPSEILSDAKKLFEQLKVLHENTALELIK